MSATRALYLSTPGATATSRIRQDVPCRSSVRIVACTGSRIHALSLDTESWTLNFALAAGAARTANIPSVTSALILPLARRRHEGSRFWRTTSGERSPRMGESSGVTPERLEGFGRDRSRVRRAAFQGRRAAEGGRGATTRRRSLALDGRALSERRRARCLEMASRTTRGCPSSDVGAERPNPRPGDTRACSTGAAQLARERLVPACARRFESPERQRRRIRSRREGGSGRC